MIASESGAGGSLGPDGEGTASVPRPRLSNPVLAGTGGAGNGKLLHPTAAGEGGGRMSSAERELRAMQLSLDAYVRLLLRRLFYAIPMNVKNIVMGEFRKDLVALVARRYTEEAKLRALMSEELWLGHKRVQAQERMASLEGVLASLDQLS